MKITDNEFLREPKIIAEQNQNREKPSSVPIKKTLLKSFETDLEPCTDRELEDAILHHCAGKAHRL